MSRSLTGNCQRISLNYCNKNNIVGKHEPFESAADSYRSVLCNPQRARDNARTHNDSAFRDIPLFWPKHWHWSIVDPLLTIYRLLGCYIEGLPSFFEKMWLSIWAERFRERNQRAGSVDDLIFVRYSIKYWVIWIGHKCNHIVYVWSYYFFFLILGKLNANFGT